MEEVPPAAAALLDLLSPGGWGRVVKEGYTKHRVEGVGGIKSKTTTRILQLRAKLDKLFGSVNTSGIQRFGEGLGSKRAFLSLALLAAGKVPREGAGKDGGGRPLLSRWLLTKQFCQLAVGAAWGFAIELLEGGGGCAGGREGRAGPAAATAAPSPSWQGGLGPLGTATGSFGGDARAKGMRLHLCLFGQWCGALSISPSPLYACPVQERVPVRLVPAPPSPAASEPSGARASAKIARAGCWGARSALPSELGAG